MLVLSESCGVILCLVLVSPMSYSTHLISLQCDVRPTFLRPNRNWFFGFRWFFLLLSLTTMSHFVLWNDLTVKFPNRKQNKNNASFVGVLPSCSLQPFRRVSHRLVENDAANEYNSIWFSIAFVLFRERNLTITIASALTKYTPTNTLLNEHF